MHITIIGASRFGIATVRQLIGDGHEVVLVDTDREKLDELSDELDCGMIHGDGTLPSTLKDAFGDGSDALVALTNADNVNILASVVGRSVGYERVIPQIVRSELLSLVDALNLDDTITPHESVARSIVSALIQNSSVETEMALHRELRIVSHKVPASMAGKTIGDLDLPRGCRVIARVRDEHEDLAEDDVSLDVGDRLMLVMQSEDTDQLDEIFKAE